jgi:hypothetical protein
VLARCFRARLGDADETMTGFTGATNIHLTVLPDKPTSKGVCLKTLCDASTRVMIAAEFVESKAEQVLSTTLRRDWHLP